jgi:hypothetical protein
MNIRGYVATLLNALPMGTRQPVQQAFDALIGEQSGVTAGTYGSSHATPVLTIDGRGRVTAASESTFSAGSSTSVSGAITYSSAVGNEPSANVGDLYFPTNGYAVERYTGSAWHQWGMVFPLTDPNLQSFAWVNQGGAASVSTNGGIFLRAPVSSAANYRIQKKSAPTPPYTVTAAINPTCIALNFQQAGILFRQASDGKFVTFGFEYATPGVSLAVYKYNSPTSFNASYQVQGFSQGQQPTWLRITDNGSNRVCSWSVDGQNFIQFHSVGRTDFLTADEVGFFVNDQTNTIEAGNLLLSWKET